MEKEILEIAKSITDPISLVALVFLIIFLILRSVVKEKTETLGESGSLKILTYIVWLVGLFGLFGLTYAFSLKAYEIYSAPKISQSDISVETEKGGDFSNSLMVGNNGFGIVWISELSLHWNFSPCLRYDPPLPPKIGEMVKPRVFSVNLVNGNRKVQLIDADFVLRHGEVEFFRVDLESTPGNQGNYTVWWEFNYRQLGTNEQHRYRSTSTTYRVCRRD